MLLRVLADVQKPSGQIPIVYIWKQNSQMVSADVQRCVAITRHTESAWTVPEGSTKVFFVIASDFILFIIFFISLIIIFHLFSLVVVSPFYSVLVFISIFIALSNMFHSKKSLPTILCFLALFFQSYFSLIGPFNYNVSLWKSSSALI